MEQKGINNRYTAAPVLILALSMLFSSIGWILNVGGVVFPLILAVAVVMIFGLIRDRRLFFAALLSTVLTILACGFAAKIKDMSYDGMYFHKSAVHALANGWNPLKESFSDFDRFGNLQDLPLWMDNYPKGVWAAYAAVYKLTGQIEAAKGINLLFLLMLFFAAYDMIKTVFSKKGFMGIMLAAALAANPVILSQYFTFMNDLPVAVLILVCACLGIKIYAKKADRWDYLTLTAAFAASFGVKFTAPVFCGITLLAYGVAVGIKSRGKELLKPCISVAVAAVIGVCALGADPYVKHILNGQHPIYPVMGEGKYDIMNTNLPAGFDELSGTEQFFISIASKCSPNPGDIPILKIPFTADRSELEALGAPDVRLAGFGVFFSGILILAFFLGLFAIWKSKRTMSLVPAIAIFGLMALFFPESWWARYNPYTYYIPGLVLLAFSTVPKTELVSYLMSLLMLVNGVISGSAVYWTFRHKTEILDGILESIRQDGRKVLLNINDFPCHAVWFEEAGIDFELTNQFDPEQEEFEFYRTTKYQFEEQ